MQSVASKQLSWCPWRTSRKKKGRKEAFDRSLISKDWSWSDRDLGDSTLIRLIRNRWSKRKQAEITVRTAWTISRLSSASIIYFYDITYPFREVLHHLSLSCTSFRPRVNKYVYLFNSTSARNKQSKDYHSLHMLTSQVNWMFEQTRYLNYIKHHNCQRQRKQERRIRGQWTIRWASSSTRFDEEHSFRRCCTSRSFILLEFCSRQKASCLDGVNKIAESTSEEWRKR